jgi:uncharacterized membrane protein YeaQ/YmgE (transglycosylase-associated protein family)
MSVVLWLLAGSIAAWITRSLLNLNAGGFLSVAAILGPVGVIFGGEALPPSAAGGVGALMRPFAVLVACVGAIAFLYLIRAIYRTWRSRMSRRLAAYNSA